MKKNDTTKQERTLDETSGRSGDKNHIMPSTQTLSTLAATMNKSPEEALRLWLQTEKLQEKIAAMPEALRQDALNKFTVFTDRSFDRCCKVAFIMHPWKEVQELVGVYSRQTLEKLMNSLYPTAGAEAIRSTVGHFIKEGVPTQLIEPLKSARLAMYSARGRNNKQADVNPKRKKGKPVK